MLNVPLSTTSLGGGIQKALTIVECFQDHSRAQKSSRYLECILGIFFDVYSKIDDTSIALLSTPKYS
jgi:hypothetical protein